MSITVRNVVKSALRKLMILQPGEDPSADAMQDAVADLNNMLHAWEMDGIKLNHTSLVVDDTLPYPDKYHEAIIYNLAVKIAPDYETMASQTVIAVAANGYANMQNDLGAPKDIKYPTELTAIYRTNRTYR